MAALISGRDIFQPEALWDAETDRKAEKSKARYIGIVRLWFPDSQGCRCTVWTLYKVPVEGVSWG